MTTRGSGDRPALTVIVPFLNEADTLRTALDRLAKVPLPVPLQVIAVDDGSTDRGAETIADLVQDDRVELIRHASNRGKGAALVTGLKSATGDWVTVLDADLEYDPTDFGPMLKPLIEGEAEVVYGKRMFASHTAYSFWFVIGNRFVALWASLLFDTWLSDIYTCFKIAPRSEWEALGLSSKGFGIEAEITAKFLARGHRIHEVPISYKARPREEGKKIRVRDGVAAVWVLLKWRLRRSRISRA